jgi:putative transport protein
MKWLVDLLSGNSVAQTMIVLCLVAATGLALGSLKVRGIGLGIAGVLFTGLAFGQFGVKISHEVADFMREFGLILFVYTIGMQVGPGFLASLRKQGAVLNALAAGIVILGALLALAAHRLLGIPIAATVGLYSGATTNTPSLAAAQEALKSMHGLSAGAEAMPGLAYAVAYPFGIVGIILAMLAIRAAFRISVKAAEDAFRKEHEKMHPRLEIANLIVRNPNLEGTALASVPGLAGSGIVISRMKSGGVVSVARDDALLHKGDILLAVGPPEKIENLRIVVGETSNEDLRAASGEVSVRRIIVTRKEAIGRTLADLNLGPLNNVRFTRLSRAEVDLPDPVNRRLQAGDTLTVVGEEPDLDKVAKILGNSAKDLNHPQIIPVFVGIGLGVLVGSIPFFLPGIPSPVRLGLAGGPLLLAIVLSYIGRIGPLLWHMPTNANFLLREIGIVMFLSVVGLKSGGLFLETLLAGDGFLWMAVGAGITLLPLLIAGFVATALLRLNYLTTIGLLAGSMTDPPALAFANSLTSTAAPSVSYAAVYPLTMLLRVVCAQLLVLVFA